MAKHVSELTTEEIVAIGERASGRAVVEAAAEGVTVTGYLTDAEGNLWFVRRAPDGEVDWIELRYPHKQVTDETHKITDSRKRAG